MSLIKPQKTIYNKYLNFPQIKALAKGLNKDIYEKNYRQLV